MGAVVAAEEVQVLALVPAAAVLAECLEAVAQVQEGLAPAEVQEQRVNPAAFGKVVVVPAPEEVWEPVAPRVEEQAVGRAADQVRAPEERADPVADLVEVAGAVLAQGLAAAPALEAELVLVGELALAAAEEPVLAAEDLVLAAELVVAVGARKHLENG